MCSFHMEQRGNLGDQKEKCGNCRELVLPKTERGVIKSDQHQKSDFVTQVIIKLLFKTSLLLNDIF